MIQPRRKFLKTCAALSASLAVAQTFRAGAQADAAQAGGGILIQPRPLFDLSPWLYMQFMEPLGSTDSSVEAAWDYNRDDWRRDFVEATKELAPDVMRFGGLFSRYYKWREGVGPAARRPWMRNYAWGGKETNRVGTHEFVDYCRRVNAEPLYCVNFLSDGFAEFAGKPEGNRTGDAAEAADWVSYANDPDHAERKSHGHAAPYNLKLWQLGNETNYGRGGFAQAEGIARTIEFAKAMRARDPKLQLIAWGDNGWATEMAKQAGEFVDMIAIHMMNQGPPAGSVLQGLRYQAEPERAWEALRELFNSRLPVKLGAALAQLDAAGTKHRLAVTEGHLSLAPHNANPLLTEWLTGVHHARSMNLYQRHGDRVAIATAADFNGTRWTCTALMSQVPAGVSYLLPVGAVMRLFKRRNGRQGVKVASAPDSLDIAASRTGDKIFLHVANMNYSGATEASFAVEGFTVNSGRVFEIAPENPRQAIDATNPKVFEPREHALAAGDTFRWRFPARSVSAVELDCRAV